MHSNLWIPDRRGEPRRARPLPASGLDERVRSSSALMPALVVLTVAVIVLAAMLASSHRLALVPVSATAPTGAAAATVAPTAATVAAAAPSVPIAAAQRPARPAAAPPAANARPASPAGWVAATASPASVAAPVRATPVGFCANCGVVESVVTLERQGRVPGIGSSEIGLGAVGGAVVGGLLGSQVGGGNGRTLATVLGAAGGAWAGHEIEKRSRRELVHQHHVRMDDGSRRVVEQASAVAVGTRVQIDGGQLRPAASQPAPAASGGWLHS